VLSVIREGAQSAGYRVQGFAPTSRAGQKLSEAGMETSTLQKHLARGEQADTGEKRLSMTACAFGPSRPIDKWLHRLSFSNFIQHRAQIPISSLRKVFHANYRRIDCLYQTELPSEI
jgi:hypothetical protein